MVSLKDVRIYSSFEVTSRPVSVSMLIVDSGGFLIGSGSTTVSGAGVVSGEMTPSLFEQDISIRQASAKHRTVFMYFKVYTTFL